jgi:archaellum component FlaC
MQTKIKEQMETKGHMMERQLADYQREIQRLKNEVKESKTLLEEVTYERDDLAAEIGQKQSQIDLILK